MFSVIAVAVLLALIAVPGPSGVDPRTGERLASSAVALNALRRLGDANEVLGALPELRRRWPDEYELIRVVHLLSAEMTAPRKVCNDRKIAADTEEFFAPVANGNGGIDARACALAAHLAAGKSAPLPVFLELADDFEDAGRARARLRWLLRAQRSYPDAVTLAIPLARALLSAGRVEDALAVTMAVDTQDVDDPVFFALRAKLAAWVDRPAIEAEALERGMPDGGDPDAERRLIELYEYLGRPHLGVPHALNAARRSGADADRTRAVELALRAGESEAAFELLLELASEDPVYWLPRIAEFAVQDLRFELAIRCLERLQRLRPDREVEDRLIALYRRRDMPRELADALVARFEADPREFRAGFEAVGILLGSGRREEAAELEAKLRSPVDPVGFLAGSRAMHHARVPGLGAMVLAMVRAPALRADDVATALEHLRPLARRARFRPAVDLLLERFADHPAVCAFRVHLVDTLPDTTEQVAALFELSNRYPNEVFYATHLVERTAWLDDRKQQMRARQILLRLKPDDDENREALATLLDASGRAAEALPHWRYLAEQADASISASVRYVRAVVAAKAAGADHGDPFEWLRRRARRSDSTPEYRLSAADLLFESNHADAAREFYLAHLEDEPDHPRALLRIGLIQSWTHDPGGAVSYFRRRLKVSERERPRVRFHLAEALWAVGKRGEALDEYRAALDAMQSLPSPTVDTSRRIAKAQLRLGRFELAETSYRQLVARAPNRVDVHLDLLQLLLERDRLPEAEHQLSVAKRLDPNAAGVLRGEAQILLRRRRFTEAQRVLQKCLTSYGADAGIYAQLANAYEQSGDYPASVDAYRRWFALQQGSAAAARSTARGEDRVADYLGLRFGSRVTGDDELLESTLDFSVGLRERTRLFGVVGHGHYRGRAAAVAAGTRDITADTTLFDLGFSYRFLDQHEIGAGAMLHPNLDGDEAGGWVDLHLRGGHPYRSVEIRAHANELLTNPLAAPGLEGRSDGVELRGFFNYTDRVWSGFEVDDRRLRVRDPATGRRVEDEYFTAHASIGYTWLRGESAVAERFRSRRTPPGPISPYLGDAAEPGWRVTTWLTYEAIRLRGDEALLDLLPLGNRFDYVLLAGRIDRKLANGLGGKLEVYAGTDIRGQGSVWGADLAATLRPNRMFETSASVGIGDELGRAGSDSRAVHLNLSLSWRW